MSPVRPTVLDIGTRLDPGHYRLRDFLTRTAQPHEWYELGSPEATERLESRGLVGGVYYAAGRSEAAGCGGDDVIVIGAGNSAGQAVLAACSAAAGRRRAGSGMAVALAHRRREEMAAG